jgi:membrane-associated protease RseP (regulator of RpoE activity)
MSQQPLEPEILPGPAERIDGPVPMYRSSDGGYYVAVSAAPRPPRRRLALILFVLTVLSTFYVGGEQFGGGGWKNFITNGAIYSAAVLAILMAHEMGHYLQARRHHVPVSLPYFIPMPFLRFGTMGAVIVQQAGVADRRSMFDIAVSGPLAGLAVAIPLAFWGLHQAEVTPILHGLPADGVITVYQEPLILKGMEWLMFGSVPNDASIQLNPYLFAGWVGFFITALNLIPIGQLDGGHILYCLLRERANQVARFIFLFGILVVVVSSFQGRDEYASWWPMLILLWLMGTRHPPTSNDRIPLGRFRTIIGWLTLAFIVVGFTPTPIRQYEVRPATPAPVERNPAREIHV